MGHIVNYRSSCLFVPGVAACQAGFQPIQEVADRHPHEPWRADGAGAGRNRQGRGRHPQQRDLSGLREGDLPQRAGQRRRTDRGARAGHGPRRARTVRARPLPRLGRGGNPRSPLPHATGRSGRRYGDADDRRRRRPRPLRAAHPHRRTRSTSTPEPERPPSSWTSSPPASLPAASSPIGRQTPPAPPTDPSPRSPVIFSDRPCSARPRGSWPGEPKSAESPRAPQGLTQPPRPTSPSPARFVPYPHGTARHTAVAFLPCPSTSPSVAPPRYEGKDSGRFSGGPLR